MLLNSFLLDFLKSTQLAAIASTKWIGSGEKDKADLAAVEAIRNKLNASEINARVVIGEGERDRAPMLFIDEQLGSNTNALAIDIAVDPLEGTNLCANDAPGAMSVIAFAEQGNILHAPDIYMQKLIVSKGYEYTVNINKDIKENIQSLACAKQCSIAEIKVIILNRARHFEIISKARAIGAKVTLIEDGDVSAVLEVLLGRADMYIGIGGAPEGVLAAAAARCFGAEFFAKLIAEDEDEIMRAKKYSITDFSKIYKTVDLVKGNAYFIATGVTSGKILKGVEYKNNKIITHSLIIFSGHMWFLEDFQIN